MPDHVHMCIEIPPKYPVAGVIGLLKGGVRLRLPDSCAARSEISRLSIFGLEAMPSPRSGLNCSKSGPTSANKRMRMVTAGAREIIKQGGL
jgi:hypothetical protein